MKGSENKDRISRTGRIDGTAGTDRISRTGRIDGTAGTDRISKTGRIDGTAPGARRAPGALGVAAAALHFLVGAGGVAGGLGALSNPNAPMGISTDILKYGPFRSFLIPGLFLLIVLGGGNLAAGVLALTKAKGRECLTACMGGILVAWIVIQCLILWTVNGLHAAFFAVGAVQGCLGLALIVRNGAFPLPLARTLLARG